MGLAFSQGSVILAERRRPGLYRNGHRQSAMTYAPGARPREMLLVIAFLLIAAALILPALGHKDLWIDEADSVYFAQHPWFALLFDLYDPHPPGYYASLKLALALGGTSEFAVRLPSALAGILAIALLARLMRELHQLEPVWVPARARMAEAERAPQSAPERPLPWLPAALLAVAPLHVWYAQEARMYALVTLLGLGAAVFAARLMRRWYACDAAAYFAIASVALLVDQSALIVLLPLALIGAVAVRRCQPAKQSIWGALQATVPLPLALWWWRAGALARLSSGTLYPLTMARLTLERWAETIEANRWIVGVAAGLAAVAVAVTVLWARHGRRRQPASRQTQASPGSRWSAWAIVCLYGVGTLISVLPRLYTLKRVAVSLLPYALIAVAWAMARLGVRRLALGIVLGCSLALSIFSAWSIPKDPWREALATIAPLVSRADILWIDELAVPVATYYADAVTDGGVVGKIRPWRARALAEPAAPLPTEGRLWFVAQATRYRNLFDAYPALSGCVPDWTKAWRGIEVRAYNALRLNPTCLAPQTPVVNRLLEWPSPLDDACRAP